MGLGMYMIRMDDSIRHRLLADPSEYFDLTGATRPHPPKSLLRDLRRLLEMVGLRKSEPPPEPAAGDMPPLARANDEDCCDLDKSWNVIHFLLTGYGALDRGEFPHNFLGSGESLPFIPWGPESSGLFTPEEVRAIADMLDAQDEVEMKKRFRFDALGEADVYPAVWDNPEEGNRESEWEYAFSFFVDMRKFIRDAANTHQALLVIFC